jgi:acetyl esterase/lipase
MFADETRTVRRPPTRVLTACLALAASTAIVAGCGGGETAADPAASRPASTTAPACSGEAQLDVAYARRVGAAPALTSLDVHPAPRACTTTPAAVVIWVHGGGWWLGDKANPGAKVGLFHDLGAAVVSVNYRLSSRPRGDDATGGAPVRHPDHARDVAAAVSWVAAHAPGFGADPERMVLVGHSAGAHLVALVGVDPRYLEDAQVPAGAVECVVALDTEGYDLEARVAAGSASAALVRNAFGDDPALWRDASPVTHAGDGAGVRLLVVSRGTARRRAEAARFVDAVAASGGDAELVEVPGYSHADVNRRLGEAGEGVLTPRVAAFVRDCTGM